MRRLEKPIPDPIPRAPVGAGEPLLTRLGEVSRLALSDTERMFDSRRRGRQSQGSSELLKHRQILDARPRVVEHDGAAQVTVFRQLVERQEGRRSFGTYEDTFGAC